MRTHLLPTLLLAVAGLTGTAACAAQDDTPYTDVYASHQYDESPAYADPDWRGDRYDDDYRYGDGHRRGPSDAILHERVHRAIERAMGARALRIGVEVVRGNVYLSGTVSNWRDREYAHDVAHGVRGVRGVYYSGLAIRRGYYRY
jgi:hypothetical protein